MELEDSDEGPGREGRITGSGAAARAIRALARLGLLASEAKAAGLDDRQLREALAIERHARVLQPADQLAVGEAVLARGGVDADDPQPPEIALLAAPADERVA